MGVLSSHGLPALSLVAGRFDSVAQRPMCRLADLFNPFEDVFAIPFVYRHPEGLPAVRGFDDRDRQIAADVCLRFWLLRRLQDLENLLGVCGRLEAGKKQVYVGFIGEEHLARSLILQSGFKGVETSSLDLEWIRDKLVLAEGVPHLRVGEFNEDAILDGDFDHLPLPIVASRAGDARSVFLDGHLQPKDDCGLVLIEHGHAPPAVDDGQLPIERVRDIPSDPVDRPYPGCGNLSCEVLRPLLSSEPLFDEFGPIRRSLHPLRGQDEAHWLQAWFPAAAGFVDPHSAIRAIVPPPAHRPRRRVPQPMCAGFWETRFGVPSVWTF